MDVLLKIVSDLQILLIVGGLLCVMLAALKQVRWGDKVLAEPSPRGRPFLGLVAAVLLAAGIAPGVMGMVVPPDRPDTAISLSGRWKVRLVKQNGDVRAGTATICQRPGDALVTMRMNIESRNRGINSFTVLGRIDGGHLRAVYESTDHGVYKGAILEDLPENLHLVYTDLIGHDSNGDSTGTITFTREGGSAPTEAASC